MIDYHRLIAQAVEGLEQNTGRARRALYERARATHVRELRAIRPPLSESAIAKERLSLEVAIREVETDAARKSGTKQPETRSDIAPAQPSAVRVVSQRFEQVGPRNARAGFVETEPSRPARPSAGRLRRWLTGTRSIIGDAVGEVQRLYAIARAQGRGEGPTSSQTRSPADEKTSRSPDDFKSGDAGGRRATIRGLPNDLDEDLEALHIEQHLPHAIEGEHLQPLPPRNYRGFVKPVATLLMAAGLGAAIFLAVPNVSELYRNVRQIAAKQQPSQTAAQTPSQSKFLDRVPQDQSTPQAPPTPDNQASLTAAQRVVLYEEDSSDSQGKRYFGLVTWRTETMSPAPRSASDVAVRADVKIPERRTTMTWLLRRNLDHALPASHTIEIMFNLPADFAAGSVASVPGIMMKHSEEVPGTPLTKLAVKATNGVFKIELSADAADVQRNIQLLKESQWFDIPIVYVDGTRAIMAVEKGPPGDRAITEAFAAWEKE